MTRIEKLLLEEIEAMAEVVGDDNEPTGFEIARLELIDILQTSQSHGILDGLRAERVPRKRAIEIVRFIKAA